jgi:hypothetical protein
MTKPELQASLGRESQILQRLQTDHRGTGPATGHPRGEDLSTRSAASRTEPATDQILRSLYEAEGAAWSITSPGSSFGGSRNTACRGNTRLRSKITRRSLPGSSGKSSRLSQVLRPWIFPRLIDDRPRLRLQEFLRRLRRRVYISPSISIRPVYAPAGPSNSQATS